MTVKQLAHLNLSVVDLAESMAWYQRVFGFERVEGGVWEGIPWAIIRSGEAMLCLYHVPGRSKVSPTLEADALMHRINHVGLRIHDAAAWEATLSREGIVCTKDSPLRYGGSTSWYLHDPTGYKLEVVAWDQDRISFPEATEPARA